MRKKRPSKEELAKRLELLEKDGLKYCKNCDQTKTAADFAADKRHYDGLQTYCRYCSNLLIKTKYHKKVLASRKRRNIERKEEFNEWSRQYYYDNREYLKQKSREWKARNAEQQKEYKRKYHQDNYDKENEQARRRTKQWIKDNPDRHLENVRRRELRKKNADGFHTNEQWSELLELCEGKCLSCEATEDIARDHILPLSKDGSDYIDNIQPLCQSCNSKKYLKTTDYRPQHIREWATQ